MTAGHPSRDRRLFLYELGVDEGYRHRGIGDDDNAAAFATYRRSGATEESAQTMLTWELTPESR